MHNTANNASVDHSIEEATMSFFDRLFGRKQEPVTGPTQRLDQDQLQNPPQNDDERAVERYRYMLRTAPPETIEQAHAEAFAQLTPEQRQMVLQQISSNLPNAERPRQDDPQSLARAATRAEMRQPGTLVQIFQSTPPMGYGMGMGGMGMGGMLGGSFLTTMAGAFVGTAIANQFFDNNPMIYNDYGDAGAEAGAGDATDLSTEVDYADPGADAGYNDAGYSDAGFDQGGFGGGDFGGDFGGGDFGGGDFGGGDF
jgi:hypothetical protein